MSFELAKCHLCTQYVSTTKDGRAMHMRKAHGVVVRQAAPLNPEEKAVIVARMEQRIGLQHFIIPEPKPIPAKKAHLCNKCGPTDSEGYWLENKTGICEPCLKSQTEVEPIEEIPYYD